MYNTWTREEGHAHREEGMDTVRGAWTQRGDMHTVRGGMDSKRGGMHTERGSRNAWQNRR